MICLTFLIKFAKESSPWKDVKHAYLKIQKYKTVPKVSLVFIFIIEMPIKCKLVIKEVDFPSVGILLRNGADSIRSLCF